MAIMEGKRGVADLQQEKELAQVPMSRSSIVQGIKELVDGGLHAVPPLYVRPPDERPESSSLLSNMQPLPQYQIPIVDLTALDGAGAARVQVMQEIGRACEDWGFFQVVNHGVELAVIQQLQEAAFKFFDQPAQERMRFYTQSIGEPIMYRTSFNPAMEDVREWRDSLGFNRIPGVCDGFQDAPELCKKEVQQYMKGVDAIAGKVFKAIFESLGVEKYLENEVQAGTIPRVRMSINYYPPCPEPSLTLGVSAHSDVSTLTVLHPDVVPGLEIKHEGTWIPVIPTDPSALVINVADQIEIWTNGKYKSIEHRVVTNTNKPRMSIACFYGPSDDTVVAPLPTLVDENHPPCYKPTKFEDYLKNFSSNKLLANRGTLDLARL